MNAYIGADQPQIDTIGVVLVEQLKVPAEVMWIAEMNAQAVPTGVLDAAMAADAQEVRIAGTCVTVYIGIVVVLMAVGARAANVKLIAEQAAKETVTALQIPVMVPVGQE